MKKTIICLALIFILGFWGIKALASPGFYTSHDGQHHTARMANYYLALIDGQFPPRWAPNFNGHLGSPIFVFIYPLPYIIGALLHFGQVSFTDAFKLAIALSYIFSGVAFYFWLKPRFGHLSALIGALFYLWAPYRFLLIFVRGAYPESLAYAFIPILFLAIDKVTATGRRRWISIGSLALAAVMLSQNLVAFVFIPLAIIYTLVSATPPKSKVILNISLMIFIGLLISSFIYLPDVFELKETQYARLMTYSQSNFVYFWQFLRSPWGYGFSVSGETDGMSFQIGLTQIVIVLLSFFFALYYLFRKRVAVRTDKNFPLFIFSLSVFVLAVFLMTESPLTHLIWRTVPGLATIDYPWRLLGVTVFTISVMAAWLISVFPKALVKPLALLLIISLLIANRNFLRVNQRIDLPDNYLLTFAGRETHLGEFTPKGRISIDEFPHPERGDFYDGTGSILSQEINSTYQSFTLNVLPKKGLSKFRINTLYFPGWHVRVDGKEQNFDRYHLEVTGGIDLKSNVDVSGMMGVMLPEGMHKVEAKFTETPIRLIGDWLSLLGLAAALGLLLI